MCVCVRHLIELLIKTCNLEMNGVNRYFNVEIKPPIKERLYIVKYAKDIYRSERKCNRS